MALLENVDTVAELGSLSTETLVDHVGFLLTRCDYHVHVAVVDGAQVRQHGHHGQSLVLHALVVLQQGVRDHVFVEHQEFSVGFGQGGGGPVVFLFWTEHLFPEGVARAENPFAHLYLALEHHVKLLVDGVSVAEYVSLFRELLDVAGQDHAVDDLGGH